LYSLKLLCKTIVTEPGCGKGIDWKFRKQNKIIEENVEVTNFSITDKKPNAIIRPFITCIGFTKLIK